jgi:uncharacterized protein YdiU (UPF0061 family)
MSSLFIRYQIRRVLVLYLQAPLLPLRKTTTAATTTGRNASQLHLQDAHVLVTGHHSQSLSPSTEYVDRIFSGHTFRSFVTDLGSQIRTE